MAKPKQQEIKRQRKSVDQRIADLAAKITALKEREARKQVKADPAKKHAAAALKAIDKAFAASTDADTKQGLERARAALRGCIGLEAGVLVPRARAGAPRADLSEALLTYVRNNPGQRGEQIASALGTDTGAMRPSMKRLIADGKVTTAGQRRGMTYSAV